MWVCRYVRLNSCLCALWFSCMCGYFLMCAFVRIYVSVFPLHFGLWLFGGTQLVRDRRCFSKHTPVSGLKDCVWGFAGVPCEIF